MLACSFFSSFFFFWGGGGSCGESDRELINGSFTDIIIIIIIMNVMSPPPISLSLSLSLITLTTTINQPDILFSVSVSTAAVQILTPHIRCLTIFHSTA